ncbi:uroporphyrinogen-III synthase [Psychrobacter sp. Ps3]|uniref:uroporphyrinogen-III synthase n=1 Tax=Psychrobacter sp. Ps3 TaxID=2790957 RepID=UPI001EDF9CDD
MPTSMSRNLSPVVINTRPIERAAPLTEHLQDVGFAVVEMPMLRLQTRAVVDADIDIMRRWLAGDYQALVVVSPTAAQSGLTVWQALIDEQQVQPIEPITAKHAHYEPPSAIIAVGDATAEVLQAATQPVLQPLIANNEGMLAMPEIERLQAGDKLLVWRGLGGRRLLVDTLQARGVEIESIAWYERMMPNSAASDYATWLASYLNQQDQASTSQPKPIVIISSGTAFEYWVSVVQQAQTRHTGALRLDDFRYVVLGVRLAGMVAAQQLMYIQVEDLSPETISMAINTP